MERTRFARIAAVVCIVLAAVATMIEVGQDGNAPAESPDSRRSDPLRSELIRCQELGEAATRDAACLRVWGENRKRFLGAGTGWQDPLPAKPSVAPPGAGPSEARPETGPLEAD